MIDNHTWDMIRGKSGRLPGALAPEISALAKEKGYEFTDEDPQKNYPEMCIRDSYICYYVRKLNIFVSTS